MSRSEPGKVLGVIGWSGSGKTTLLEYLVSSLSASGMRVNVVKHSHHDVQLEPPHKDSARFRQAGAAEVMLASPYRIAVMRELREAPEPPLSELLPLLAPADLTLVEGYKWEALPKLEVYRSALGGQPLYPGDAHVVAVASDVPRPADAPAALAWLDLNSPPAVLAWLNGWLERGT